MGPDDKNRDARGWAKGAFCGREPQDGRCGSTGAPVKTLRNVRGARGWPCGVRERVFRIGPIRHCISDRAIYFDMLTCRHADMPTCWIKG